MELNQRIKALEKLAQYNANPLKLPTKQEIRDTYNANAAEYRDRADTLDSEAGSLDSRAKKQQISGQAVGIGGTLSGGMVAGAGLKQMAQGKGWPHLRPGAGKFGGGLAGADLSLWLGHKLNSMAEANRAQARQNRAQAVQARDKAQTWVNQVRELDSAPTKRDNYGRQTGR